MNNSDETPTTPVDTSQGGVMRRVDQVIDDLHRGRVSQRQVDALEPAVKRAQAHHGVGRAVRP